MKLTTKDKRLLWSKYAAENGVTPNIVTLGINFIVMTDVDSCLCPDNGHRMQCSYAEAN